MHVALLSSSPVVAAAEPTAQPISVETALLVVLGIALVFAFKAIAHLQRRVEGLHAAARKPKPPAVPVAGDAGISPEVLAVIAAAVVEEMGEEARIVAISMESHNNTWSIEGRRQIFGSRKVR